MDFSNFKTNLKGIIIESNLLNRNMKYSGADILLYFYEELLGLGLKKWTNPNKKAQQTIANFDEQLFASRTESTWANGVHNIYKYPRKKAAKPIYSIRFVDMVNNPEELENLGKNFPEVLQGIAEKL